jgi:arginyl-tRNA synthetase
LYATTDLAALQHRTHIEKADRIIYVTDAGQAQHFEMVFKAAQQANMVPREVKLVHVPFGLVQGEDGKKIKSRAGDSVKLKELLNEAIRIAEENESSRRLSASSNNNNNNANNNSSKDNVHVEGIDSTSSSSGSSVTGGLLSEELQRRARIIGLGEYLYIYHL